MRTRVTAIFVFCGFLGSACVAVPSRLMAQAPPGPIVPKTPSQESQAPPAQPAARPKPQQAQPRTSIAGDWKLNRDESDDPRTQLQGASRTSGSNPGGYPGGGYPGGGYPGGGYPGGYPGGRQGGGSPFPGQGGGGPYGGRGGQDPEEYPRVEQLVRPANSLGIVLKTAEVDVTDDEVHELIFYTDGRRLQKSAYDNRQEIAAHWNGSQLESDEKSPLSGKMNRTFALSVDGRQLYETLHLDNSRSRAPIVLRYVYDIPNTDVGSQTGREADPNQPVLRRRSDDNSPPQQY